jgi:hypothetical protein
VVVRSSRLCVLAGLPFAWCALAGCSGGNSASPTDSGIAVVSPFDSGAADSARPEGADSGLASADSGIVPDGASAGCPGVDAGAGPVEPPVGRLLAAGNALSARGMTSDGYEVYSDDAALQLYAIPIAGGAAQSLGALGSKFWVTVVGQVAFIWSNVTAANVGALKVWSSAQGSHAMSPASFGILGTTSPDGTQILYVANVDAQGMTGDVYVAGTDGSGATRLLQGQQLSGCFPQLGFAGSYAIASHCDVPRGAGPSSTITSFRSPAWTRADLIGEAANLWSADTAATMVLVSTNNGLLVVPIGGGPGTTIDAAGFQGQLIAGGSMAVYSTTTDILRLSSTTAPSPRMLAPSVGGFYAVAPDQKTLLYYQNSTSTGTDVYLVSTGTPSAPLALSAAPNGAVNGDAFTADSTYALFSTGNDACTGSATFNAFPTNGGSSTVLGHNVWGDWSATGGKVVFNDNYLATGGLRFGRADIKSVDLATGMAVTRVVGQADAVIDLTPALDQMVYSWSVVPGALAGLYVTPIP